MVAPFLLPSNAWHMMYGKADATGITHQVTPFMEWLREATGEPQQGNATLATMDLVDSMTKQRHEIQP